MIKEIGSKNMKKKTNNPVITVFRFLVNLITVWMIIEAGLSLNNIYLGIAGGGLLMRWILGFIEPYDAK